MKIALDFDGVIANFHQRIVTVIRNEYGCDVSERDLASWDFRMILGLNDKEKLAFEAKLFESCDNMPPVFGALHGIQQLIGCGHDLMIATNRMEKNLTIDWLSNHDVFIDDIRFLQLGDAMIEVDAILDDSPKKLAGLHAFSQKLYLMNYSYNFNCYDVKNRFIRVLNWPHFSNLMALERNR